MNKWQIICPVVAFGLVLVVGAISSTRSHIRAFASGMSHNIANELLESTNSTHLVSIPPELQGTLANFKKGRARLVEVLLGDEPKPYGDGRACSRIVLTNEAGEGMVIRLLPTDEPEKFQIIGFRGIARAQ